MSTCSYLPTELKPVLPCRGHEETYDNNSISIRRVTTDLDNKSVSFTDAQSVYSGQKLCNRLWRNFPATAASHCARFSHNKVQVKLIAPGHLKARLKTAFDTAVRLRPELDPRRLDSKINPTGGKLNIVLLENASDLPSLRPSSNAETGSNIMSNGDFFLMMYLSPDVFSHGDAYAASVIAHELFHVHRDLTGQSSLWPVAKEEIAAYQVAINVLQSLLMSASPTEGRQIKNMLAREYQEMATWQR